VRTRRGLLDRPARAVLSVLLLASCAGDASTVADPVRAAVAANFAGAQSELAALFEQRTGHRVETSSGSSGQLYAQIRNGAPFHLFLSADEERPLALEREGRTVPGSRFSYARGRLVLYGPSLDRVRAGGADLLTSSVVHVAIANPETAPYGAAAMDALEALELLEAVTPSLVRAESVAQARQFVGSGAAEMGFLALAQVRGEPRGRYWLLPDTLHRPIVQDAVLLGPGAEHEGARAYLEFLRGPEAARVLVAHGYEPAAGVGG
jgi:molybdate transport system substrate-binding protein